MRDRYLFVHFTGEHENGEQIYFSVSKDGLHYEDLNGGQPVLISEIGEKGVRDPFLIRDEVNNKFYIIATDLRIASGKGWGWAQFDASRKLIVWESENLTDWSQPWAVEIGVSDAGCVWAPEAVYDEERKAFMVFWASMTPKDKPEKAKQKIYRSFTKDFREFSAPELYIERENHVIDTDIVRVTCERDGIDGYVRFSKDETTKNIRTDYGRTLDKESFSDIHCPALEAMPGVEGPICFYIEGSKKWCLMVDRYAEGKGYIPLLSEDIIAGDFRVLEPSEFDFGKTLKRHGGILPISCQEYDSLIAKYGK